MLEILEIQICANFSPHGTATVVHSLPHLHTFIFGDDHSIETQLSLLDLFDTPALTYFAASIWTFVRNGSERTHLSNFLLRCGGQLQQLKLQGDWTLLGEIHGFIQHTPVLKSLCIAGVTFPEILTTVCPPLLQISVIVFLPVSECRPVTVDDIISQWNNTGLKTLARTTSSYTIRVPYWCPPELLKHRKLKKYIQQGLRIAMQRSHGGISVTTKQ
ncbi:hypothetical protein BD410DRAFT_789383 [Rickenella mellea]|uniref:Uncharacterized protein n=1 Tax=Rickenella mellea TaxID=50990 RepID=A0A4Y7Q3B5_9AGAM|nr:hypothetical protein BD410DRAFT_789383 [Rickenella mellea]